MQVIEAVCRHLPRIFAVLGMPTVEAWPELDALPHWRADTEGIRTVCCPPCRAAS